MLFKRWSILPGKLRAKAAKGVRSAGCLLILLLFSVVMASGAAAWDEPEQPSEYQVKAAFIYHFAKFVEWPSESSRRSPSTLTVCVLGRSPFGTALSSIGGLTVRGRRVTVTYIKRIQELESCDILFVSVSERGKLAQILSAVGTRPILTISDLKMFAAAGGMIGFIPVGDQIRFEINQRAALRSNLRISAQLLKLATSVSE